MKKFIPMLLLIPACSLAVGAAHAADAASTQATLDLRMPDLRTLHMLDPLQTTVPTDWEETQDVAIVGAPLPTEGTSDIHVSRIGIGSIYWAAFNPAQAWRVLFPITPRDGSSASEDLRVRCAIFARPPGGQAACP